jgi:hypothetical protein
MCASRPARYSCEAYGWIVEHADSKTERLALGERFAVHGFGQCDEAMDPSEVTDIVQEACHARNGWKIILGRCAPAKRYTGRPSALVGVGEQGLACSSFTARRGFWTASVPQVPKPTR